MSRGRGGARQSPGEATTAGRHTGASALVLLLIAGVGCDRSPSKRASSEAPREADGALAARARPTRPGPARMRPAPRPVPPRPVPTTAAARRQAVEQGLLPPFVIEGADHRMSLAERMKVFRVPALSVAVIHEGRLDWAAGYGVRASGSSHRVDADTLFQVGSISKPVTAVAVLRLLQAGKLRLDVPVNRYLKRWKVPPDTVRNEVVTAAKLLSHTAGLNAPEQSLYGLHPLAYKPGTKLPTTVQILRGAPPAQNMPVTPLLVHPGGFTYSGGGYVVLQLLLSELTGKGFARVVREQVFRPVGMGRSTFEMPLPARLLRTAALGHDQRGETLASGFTYVPELAAGGLWSTPSDLARLCLALSEAHQGKQGRVLSPATVARMLKGEADAPALGGRIGLGMFVKRKGDDLVFSHNGTNPGYKAILIMWHTGRRGVVAVANSDSGGHLLGELLRGVAEVYGWPRRLHAGPRRLKAATVAPATLDRYVGAYALKLPGQTQRVVVERRGDQLWATFAGRAPVRLRPYTDTDFVRVKLLATISFDGGQPGPSRGFTFRRGGTHRATRAEPTSR